MIGLRGAEVGLIGEGRLVLLLVENMLEGQ
jgi:hypothetical protein